MMNKTKVLTENKIKLNQDQKNLIELAIIKQLPPDDAKFIEKVQNEAKSRTNPFERLTEYYTAKYGMDFGMIYLSAIIGGEKKYKETIKSIEKLRLSKRIEKSKNN